MPGKSKSGKKKKFQTKKKLTEDQRHLDNVAKGKDRKKPADQVIMDELELGNGAEPIMPQEVADQEVDMNQVVGMGGEVDDSNLTSEESAEEVHKIISQTEEPKKLERKFELTEKGKELAEQLETDKPFDPMSVVNDTLKGI